MRVMADFQHETRFWHQPQTVVIGLDEVGRGCFAGPVTVGAVCFAPTGAEEVLTLGINDSKKLTARRREKLVEPIRQSATAYAHASISPAQIDRDGIVSAVAAASIAAVRQCIAAIIQHTTPLPDRVVVLTDSLSIEGLTDCLVEQSCQVTEVVIPKGDQHSISIAAASILAKVWRDAYMTELADAFPIYEWQKNKGYGTKTHRDAIREHGPCEHHRRCFLGNMGSFW